MNWSEIITSTQWAKAVDEVRDSLTQTVMDPSTGKKERKAALLKHQMVDELIGLLSSKLQE